MITKVQGKTVSGELSVKACPRLNPLEKAMLRWAVVDPEDRVLDACVGRGLMAEYLRRNERVAASYHALRQTKLSFHIGEGPPAVRRFVAEPVRSLPPLRPQADHA